RSSAGGGGPRSDPHRAGFTHCLSSKRSEGARFVRMPKADGDAKLLIQSLNKAYAATPTNLKIIDLYVFFAMVTALVQRLVTWE
uniref:Uncharacterized protein n=1 Tax=Aegilops tauschii subsp. strangulata TaxID=200361 RepID=A0A453SXW7_AEGTS